MVPVENPPVLADDARGLFMSDRPPGDPELSSLLAAIVESSDDAIIGKDLTGRMLTWNQGATRMYGYEAREAIGQSISLLIPPDHADELRDIMVQIAHGERVPPHDTVRLTKSGRRLHVSLSISPIRGAAGDIVGASAIARDISEARRLDTALRASEARWQAIVNSAIDGIVVIDECGRIESFNTAAEQLFGYPEASLVGENVKILMPAPYHEEHDGYLSRYSTTRERHIIGSGREVSGRRRDGTVFPVHLSVGEIFLGHERKFVGILHDLTSRVRSEELIREQTALARLGEMAAVIAHEVRNPLTAVSGAIQIIGESLPAGGPEAVIAKEVLARLDALNALTNDLLMFARPPRPKIGPVDVAALLRMNWDLLAKDRNLDGVHFELEAGAALVQGDVDLLQIVFQNLLINASQAMKGEGIIRVGAARQKDRVLVTIHDSGPGIPQAVRARLFQPFVTTKARGTGLGLSTAKRLIEALDGTIAIDCPPGGGTCVSVSLPAQDA
jgi:two-component system sensor kinase FixL